MQQRWGGGGFCGVGVSKVALLLGMGLFSLPMVSPNGITQSTAIIETLILLSAPCLAATSSLAALQHDKVLPVDQSCCSSTIRLSLSWCCAFCFVEIQTELLFNELLGFSRILVSVHPSGRTYGGHLLS
jgi:hypothetical protein